MDTIVFFYRKRGLREPEVEPVGLKKYLLVRVGLDAAREEWFGRRLDRMPPEGEPEDREATGEGVLLAEERGRPERKRCRWRPRFLAWQESRRRALVRREAEDWPAARARMLSEIEEAMERLASELAELAGGWRDCSYVYEDSLRRALIGLGAGEDGLRERGVRRAGEDGMWERGVRTGTVPEGGILPAESLQVERLQAESLPMLWKRHFGDREFTGYSQRFWVEQLLSRALAPHFILLGTAPCLFPLLEENAHRMKSLRWILPEGSLDGALEGFVEDFYIEYGLAIVLQVLEEPAAWKRLRLSCDEPVNVLDFTEEASLAVPALPEGSAWLDMASLEEKRRRILARGIAYLSLKEMWKSAQKRCVCPDYLDTALKQGYNTVRFEGRTENGIRTIKNG